MTGRAALAVAVLSLAPLLSGCGHANGRALAAEACTKVGTSLRLEARASTAGPASAAAMRRRAVVLLEEAEPLAAIAAGEDTEWQALQATLQEAGQVPVRYLVEALRSQCGSMLSGG